MSVPDEELLKRFKYIAPNSEAVALFPALRDKALELARLINASVPDSREKSSALTKVEEAIMHANAGIVRNQDKLEN